METGDTACSDRLAEFAAFGKTPGRPGWDRSGWTSAEANAHTQFLGAAHNLGLETAADSAGNLWAWWGGSPGSPVAADGLVATGSHLDTVPEGGSYDGALGVAAGLAAVELLQSHGFVPKRPIGVACFLDHEGTRFGTPCFGSRVLTGALDPSTVADRRNPDRLGDDPLGASHPGGPSAFARLAPDPKLVAGLRAFVEVHHEQGTQLAAAGWKVARASSSWAAGRWRIELTAPDGAPGHPGTPMAARRDPFLMLGALADLAHTTAVEREALVSVVRAELSPNLGSRVPRQARAWIDGRASEDIALDLAMGTVGAQLRPEGEALGIDVDVVCEARIPAVTFDLGIAAAISDSAGGAVAEFPITAAHDAAVLQAAGVPSGVILVRNPTGVAHAPDEEASVADCDAAVRLLAATLATLAS